MAGPAPEKHRVAASPWHRSLQAHSSLTRGNEGEGLQRDRPVSGVHIHQRSVVVLLLLLGSRVGCAGRQAERQVGMRPGHVGRQRATMQRMRWTCR